MFVEPPQVRSLDIHKYLDDPIVLLPLPTAHNTNACLALRITSSYCRLYVTLVIIIGGGHNEVTTSSVAFIVVFLLLCAALILGDGTVVTTSHVLSSSCPCLFPPCSPLFPLIRLFVMLESNLMLMGRWIGGPLPCCF